MEHRPTGQDGYNRNIHEPYTFAAIACATAQLCSDSGQEIDEFHACYMPVMCDKGRKNTDLRH